MQILLSPPNFYIMNNQVKSLENKHTNQSENKLSITFLGGIGEIGRNCTAYEYKDKIYIIDCGTIFRSSLNLGVNLALPNIDYLKNNAHKIQSILITHGHEDHVGGIKYLLKLINRPIPIYIGRFPGEIMKNNFIDSRDPLLKETCPLIHRVKNNFSYFADQDLKFKFINVTHSTPNTFFIFISTKTDTVLHTGDWKFDLTPISERTDFFHIVNLATKEGVDLVVTDSTRCDQDGFSDSEQDVIKKFDTIFEKYKQKRIFVSIFGSNADRVIKLVELAKSYNRKVFLFGWSIIKCVRAAIKINLIEAKDLFLNIDSVSKFDPSEVFVICTGAQGESEAALSKMVNDRKKNVSLNQNDLVIFSANIIPGNEKNTMKLIEKMLSKKITVFHPSLSKENGKFHVSGHGMRKDILMLLNLVKPKNFIPVHGELHHLLANINIAEEYGLNKSNIFLPDNGKSYSLFKGILKFNKLISFTERLVDNYEKYINQNIVDQRSLMSKQGAILVLAKKIQDQFSLNQLLFISTSPFFHDIKQKIESSINEMFLQINTGISLIYMKECIENIIKKYTSSTRDSDIPFVIIKFLD